MVFSIIREIFFIAYPGFCECKLCFLTKQNDALVRLSRNFLEVKRHSPSTPLRSRLGFEIGVGVFCVCVPVLFAPVHGRTLEGSVYLLGRLLGEPRPTYDRPVGLTDH